MSDKAELGIFLAAMIAFIVCGRILTRKPTKKPARETLRPAVPDEHQPAVSLSKKKGAVIGRAAGGAYRPLKKLNRVCELRGSPVALLGVLFLWRRPERQFEFGFCVECLFSQSFIRARACNSASSRDPITTLPFISTPAG